MHFFNKISKFLTAFAIWYVTYIPPILIYGALFYLVITSFRTMQNESIDPKIVIFYLTSIGLSISLAAAIFSYARILSDEEKPKVVEIGELFLCSAILLISAFLMNWLGIHLKNILKPNAIITFIISIVIGSSYAPALFAVNFLHRAIHKLREHFEIKIKGW